MNPSLLRPARERKLYHPYLLFCLLHELDAQGSGWIERDFALTCLENIGWSRRTVQRQLRMGRGVLWREEITRGASRGRVAGRHLIVLTGFQRLAEAFDLDLVRQHRVAVPMEIFGTVRDRNAIAYHLGLPRDGHGRPVARATIREITGVPERTQRRYGHQLMPDGRRQVSVKLTANYGTVPVWDSEQQITYFPRFGNGYKHRLTSTGHGQAIAYNEETQRRVRERANGNAPESSSLAGSKAVERRYFETERRLLKARKRGRATSAPFVRSPLRAVPRTEAGRRMYWFGWWLLWGVDPRKVRALPI